jgi:hypothetical protein
LNYREAREEQRRPELQPKKWWSMR